MTQAVNLTESLLLFIPESILVLTTILVILLDVAPGRRTERAPLYLTFCGLLLAGIFLLAHYSSLRLEEPGWQWVNSLRKTNTLLFSGAVAIDHFAIFFKLLFLAVAVLTGLLSVRYARLNPAGEGEYCVLLLSSTLGLFVMAGARTLLMAYLGLELVSIPSFILAGFQRGTRLSSEAALKYTMFGAIASGIMVYGMSLLYGMTGDLDFVTIQRVLFSQSAGAKTAATVSPALLSLVTLMILAGFGYKIACVPFHMWCPDVYEGAPTPITAFLSVGPKAAGLSLILRFFYQAFSVGAEGGAWKPVLDQVPWPMALAVLSVATMTVGNLAAVVQTNLKRLMAYSSIAHAGYMLMGVVVLSRDGMFSVLFYLVVYLFMNFGAFLFIVLLAEIAGAEDIAACRGLGWRAPFACTVMAVFLFSLTGIPPLGGFVGKFYLFSGVIFREMYWLAILGVLNSVISLFYYMRIVKAMFLEQIPSGEVEPQPIPAFYNVILGVLAVPVVLLGVYWAPVARFAQFSTALFGS